MASFLYRLGRFAFRRRWPIVGVWLAILAVTATGAATLSGSTSDAFRIPGTPSQQVIDLLEERFPQASAAGATARLVFAAPAGQQLTSAATKAAVEQAVAELRDAAQVASVSDPFQSGAVNQAGTVGFAQATYRVTAQELTDGDRDALTGIAERARAKGLIERKAYDLLAVGFGAGFNGPLTVVVDSPAGDAKTTAEQVVQRISALPDVVTAATTAVNPAGDTALLTVIPASGPGDTATTDLVHAIRRLDGTVTGAGIGVTGLTAINIDVSTKLTDALLPYLAVVVGLAFLLLMLVFRSLLVPIKAALGFLLSLAATFGALVALFQWGWGADLLGTDRTGTIVSSLPIVLIGIVFGLAMDYQVFLVTRMREEHVHGAAPREAVITGFGHGARVVTAAAIIMISVFAGFIIAPDPLIKSIGFGLSAAVLFDAFVVRMTIVPAVMTLLGKAAWWLPQWLNRLLPNVDVEGEKLRRRLDDIPLEPVVSVPGRVQA